MADFSTQDFIQEYKQLEQLLDQADENYDTSKVPRAKQGPALLGKQGLIEGVEVAKPTGKRNINNQDIWTADELVEDIDYDDGVDDGRYNIYYGQSVGTEDVFLGMSEMDPSSTQCQLLIVEIDMPQTTSLTDIDLDVKQDSIRLISSKYKLQLYLPHKVLQNNGKAEFIKAKQQLKLKLPINKDEW